MHFNFFSLSQNLFTVCKLDKLFPFLTTPVNNQNGNYVYNLEFMSSFLLFNNY